MHCNNNTEMLYSYWISIILIAGQVGKANNVRNKTLFVHFGFKKTTTTV